MVSVHEDPVYRRDKLESLDGTAPLGLHVNVMALGELRPGVQATGVSNPAATRLEEVRGGARVALQPVHFRGTVCGGVWLHEPLWRGFGALYIPAPVPRCSAYVQLSLASCAFLVCRLCVPLWL